MKKNQFYVIHTVYTHHHELYLYNLYFTALYWVRILVDMLNEMKKGCNGLDT